jgi:hypothetical protein
MQSMHVIYMLNGYNGNEEQTGSDAHTMTATKVSECSIYRMRSRAVRTLKIYTRYSLSVLRTKQTLPNGWSGAYFHLTKPRVPYQAPNVRTETRRVLRQSCTLRSRASKCFTRPVREPWCSCMDGSGGSRYGAWLTRELAGRWHHDCRVVTVDCGDGKRCRIKVRTVSPD